jgi:hypothetical protein
MKKCPNPVCKCTNEMAVTELFTGMFAVQCVCGVRGPMQLSEKAAIDRWDALPREEELNCICLQLGGQLNYTRPGKPIEDCHLCHGTGKYKEIISKKEGE